MMLQYGTIRRQIESVQEEGSRSGETAADMANTLAEGNYLLYNRYVRDTDPAEVLSLYGQQRFDLAEKYLDYEFNNPNDMTDIIGEGWTGETALGLAVYALKKGKSFEHCLIISTNHRGDSDSTASMAAQLYAAFKTLDSKDLEVYEKIDLKNIINKSLENIEVINNFELEKKKTNLEKKELTGVLKVIKKLFN